MSTMQPIKAARNLDATQTRVSPVQLAHVFLLTRDLPRLRAWHLTVFEAWVTFETDVLCLLSYDNEHHRIAIAALPDIQERPEGMQVGAHHFAFTYGDLGDLLHTYRRLKRQGIEPYWTINHGITTSMYYRDPDGNRIELQVDNFATAEEIDAFMTGAFRDNPVGVILDPEDLVRHHENGDAIAALRRPPKLPPGKTPWDMLRM